MMPPDLPLDLVRFEPANNLWTDRSTLCARWRMRSSVQPIRGVGARQARKPEHADSGQASACSETSQRQMMGRQRQRDMSGIFILSPWVGFWSRVFSPTRQEHHRTREEPRLSFSPPLDPRQLVAWVVVSPTFCTDYPTSLPPVPAEDLNCGLGVGKPTATTHFGAIRLKILPLPWPGGLHDLLHHCSIWGVFLCFFGCDFGFGLGQYASPRDLA
jgi:hypothetical protein